MKWFTVQKLTASDFFTVVVVAMFTVYMSFYVVAIAQKPPFLFLRNLKSPVTLCIPLKFHGEWATTNAPRWSFHFLYMSRRFLLVLLSYRFGDFRVFVPTVTICYIDDCKITYVLTISLFTHF